MLHVCECCAVIAAVLRVITKSLKLRYSLCLLVVATVSRNTICMSKQSVVYVPGWNVLMDYSLRLQISHPSPDGKIILSEMIKNLKKEKNLKKKKKDSMMNLWMCLTEIILFLPISAENNSSSFSDIMQMDGEQRCCFIWIWCLYWWLSWNHRKHKKYRPGEYHKFSVKMIRFEFSLVSEPMIFSFLISSPP